MSFKNNKCVRWMRENLLLLLILIGVVLGFLVGILLNKKVQNSKNPKPRELAMYIGFPGELFLRMLKLLILPLTVSSVIVSLAILDRKSAAKLGRRTATYFLITTFVAVILGVILASVLKPGVIQTGDELKAEQGKKNGEVTHAILDLIRNIFPDNIVEASFSSTVTKYEKKSEEYIFVNKSAGNYKESAKNLSSFLKKEMINPWSLSDDNVQVIKEQNPVYDFNGLNKYNAPNILGILVFSIVFGIILSVLGEEGKPLLQWFNCLFTVTMKMVEIFMWFSPIGICSIITEKLVAMEHIKDSVESLGMYIITVIIASLIHSLVILPCIYFLYLRANPFRLFIGVAKALLTAFGTASSAATIPVTMACLEKNHKVDRRVTEFVIPVGATVNMDGMGIYNAVSAIFIAQRQMGGSLDFGSSVIVCFAATLSSIAAASIPGSGPIVTSMIVLQAIGIRSADIALILSVDWLLDRIITPVNVWGNCIGSVIIEHLSSKDLKIPNKEEKTSETSDVNTVDFKIEMADSDSIRKTSQTKDSCTIDFEINVAVDLGEEENEEEKVLD